MNTKNAAIYIGMSHRTLEGWRRKGIGPKYGRAVKTVVYDINDLNDFIEQSKDR